jgi:hypothetical protein
MGQTRLQNANNALIWNLFHKLQFAGAAAAKGGQFYTDSHFVMDAPAEGLPIERLHCFGASRSNRHSKQGIGSRVSEPRSMHSTPPLLKRQGEPKTSSAAGDGNSQQECD